MPGELVLHHLNASRSKRMLWLLEELGAPYSVKAYLRVKGRAPPELTQVHPLGKSPVITDGGVAVAESGNIVEHLLETRDAGRALQPAADDAAGRAAHRFFLHYAEGSVTPILMIDFILNKVVEGTPWIGRPVTRGVRNAVSSNFTGPELDKHANFLEGVLAKSSYLAGDKFTAADVQMHGAVEGLLEDAARAAASPRLKAYSERLKQRPAYLRAAARDKELDAK
jgi:glutathione S-transferase